MRLKNKVAVVVGGGQTKGETVGNGRATAICFAREGAIVLVVDRDFQSAGETVNAIEAEGGSASALLADVTREPDCEAVVEECLSRHGRIDVLHNNVGRSQGDAATTDLEEENWRSLMDVNLKTVFLTCKHALPIMRQQKSGVITNISSTSSICSRRTLGYKTAKAGINAMTRNMAIENAAYGVRVNAILPGLMDTPMAIERRARERDVGRKTIRDERDAQVPMGKMGTAWDVAAAAVFLASDEASYITGVLLAVDGGLSARVG
ncbi:MAG TPA: SDR family NAD(P)-dependent oxidoreductase [Gammaproteobacteria bacterium]|nr:SDR family NAD(P)-dependent oxidoreductase [Gammaproteobacteria bacterium]